MPAAEVRWVSLADVDGTGASAPSRARTVGTDERGIYHFEEEVLATGGESVLWVTHPRFLGRFRHLAAGGSFAREDFELQGAEACHARVLGPDGGPVAGAVVVQTCAPGNAPEGSFAARARAVFERRFTSDGSGRVDWVPLEGPCRLVARDGERSSAPWIGNAPADAVLRFEAGFQVQGTVRFEGDEPLEGELHVRVERYLGNLHETVAEGAVAEDGAFGPLSVDGERADLYVVRADGGNAVPVETAFSPPEPEKVHHVELVTRAGSDLWFVLFRGLSDEMLEDGEVAVRWWDGERYVVQRARPGPERYIRVRGIPDGQATALATSPGFVPTTWGPGPVPPEEFEAYGLSMLPTGRLTGFVVDAGGVPVTDFEILGWATTEWHVNQRWSFHDREDGSFTIENPFLGTVSLVAATPRARSIPTIVQVKSEEESEVVLRLRDGVVGRGRVVDSDGRPLPQARIQRLFSDAGAVLGPWGLPHPVGPDGRFEIEGFPKEASYFEVWAPGYSRLVRPADGRAELLDFGDIVLRPPQPLTIRLLDPAVCDPSRYAVSSDDPRLFSLRRFPASGTLTFEGVDPGHHGITLHYPDGTQGHLRLHLPVGEEWDFPLRICGTASLVVEVGERPPGAGEIAVGYDFEDPTVGGVGRGSGIQPGGERTFDHLPAGKYRVQLTDLGTHVYREKVVVLAEGEERRVFLGDDGRAVRILVLDPEGEGLPGITVYVRWGRSDSRLAITDVEGLADFRDLPERDSFEVVLYDSARGAAGPLEIHPPPDGEPVVLTLDPKAAVVIRFVDGGQPVPGVPCQIRDLARDMPMSSGADANAEGLVRFESLAEGDYDLVAEKDGYWPVRLRVTARPDPPVLDVTIRRLGDVRLQLRTAEGAPVGRTRISLRSLEFDEDVAAWLASGKVASEPENLTTDARGEVLLRGLPHGAYRWHAGAGSGVLEVVGGREVVRYLALP